MSTRFVANSTTDVSRMFLLFSGRYIFVFLMQRDANMISLYNCRALYTDMGNTVNQNICHAKSLPTWTLARMFADSSPFISYELNGFGSIFWWCVCERFIFLFPFTQVSKVAEEQIKQAEKTQLQVSVEKTPLLQDDSEDTASTSYYLGNEVRN